MTIARDRPGTVDPRAHGRKLIPVLVFTGALLGLIALSIGTVRRDLALMLILSVLAVVTAFHFLFRSSQFFAIALANLTGVYACIFVFFVESNFARVDAPVLWLGFNLPLLSFLGGSLWRRSAIQALVLRQRRQPPGNIGRIVTWLVPVLAVGAVTFWVPAVGASAGWLDLIFILAMAAISAVVLFVSRDVAVFLLDTAVLFEEFFRRAARLTAPAFAFLTFYSFLVIVFASLYSVLDNFSERRLFRIDGVVRQITFPESLYFSLTTLSTVGYGDIAPANDFIRILVALEIVCGILLLLFGFNEIFSYSRERWRSSDRKDR